YGIFQVDPLDILKLSRAAADLKSTTHKDATLFDILEDGQILDSLNLRSKDKLQEVMRQLTYWSQVDADTTFTQFFETVLNDSGYLNWILEQPDVHNKVLN